MLFWHHIYQKNPRDRWRRLRYFGDALELLQESTYQPKIVYFSNKIIYYRFYGEIEKQFFIVQVKEVKTTKRKFLISCFPIDKKLTDDVEQ